MSGGNCWNDDEPTGYSSDNPPEELTSLDTILEKYKPDISYLEYKVLANKLVEHGSRTEYEYYGNETNYSSKKCNMKKLYDYLIEKGWYK